MVQMLLEGTSKELPAQSVNFARLRRPQFHDATWLHCRVSDRVTPGKADLSCLARRYGQHWPAGPVRIRPARRRSVSKVETGGPIAAVFTRWPTLLRAPRRQSVSLKTAQ